MATQLDLRNADLDSLRKTQLIQLCRDNGLPTGGLKSSLIARLLTRRSQLPPLPVSSAATANAGSQQAVGLAYTASTGVTATPPVLAIAASLSAGMQLSNLQAAALCYFFCFLFFVIVFKKI